MGPLVVVLLPRQLTSEELGDVPEILEMAAGVEPFPKTERDERVAEAMLPHISLGTYRYPPIETGSFWTTLVPVDQDDDSEDRHAMEDVIGWWPLHAIQMSAGCNDLTSHKVLGRSMWALAARFGGLIDLCGSITPPVRPSRRRLSEDKQHKLPEISAFVHGFPGTVKEWYYRKEGGQTWVHHFVDAEFMKAWLKCPTFFLVKYRPSSPIPSPGSWCPGTPGARPSPLDL